MGLTAQPDVLVKKDSLYVASLNTRTFEGNIASEFVENWIVLFCVDWYAPCAAMQRSYMVLAEKYDAKQNSGTELLRSTVRFATVDCAVDKPLCNTQLVEDYPTLRHYRAGKVHASWRGRGKMNESQAVTAWLEKTLVAPAPQADPAKNASPLLTAPECAQLMRLVASAVVIVATICWTVSRGVELRAAAASVRRQGGCIQPGAKSGFAGSSAETDNSDVKCSSSNGVEAKLPREWLQRKGMEL